MLKEMYEQPKAILDTFSPRIKGNDIVIEELGMSDEEIKAIRKIMIVACGSAYHAGVTAKYVMEGMARIPVETDLASEFRYRDPIMGDGTLVVIISQSGETADSLAALREAKQRGAKVLELSMLSEVLSQERQIMSCIHGRDRRLRLRQQKHTPVS